MVLVGKSEGVRIQQPPTARGWFSFPARQALFTASGPPESTKDGATVYVVDLDGSSLKAIDKG